MIQQYDVRWYGDPGNSKVMGMKTVDYGPYVLTTDHLAALSKRNIIIGESYQVLQVWGIKEASTHLPDAIKNALEAAVTETRDALQTIIDELRSEIVALEAAVSDF